MLRFVVGRAGAGKTGFVMNEIKQKIDSGEAGVLFIVPDQYSHDAERLMCEVCGDSLSLHGEVLSFTRLCRNVIAETGGASLKLLDAGGQVLVLFKALAAVAPSLKVFGSKNLRVELLESLAETIKEFKTHGISPEKIKDIAEKYPSSLGDKLHDLSLIYGAYESTLHLLIPSGDTTDMMTILADNIGASSVGNTGHIYFDGFNDFTASELRVIEELLLKRANITVCLTYDRDDVSEVFNLPKKTIAQLRQFADGFGVDVQYIHPSEEHLKTQNEEQVKENTQIVKKNNNKSDVLKYLEKYLFCRDITVFPVSDGIGDAIKIYAPTSRYSECEHAAYEVLKHVRSGYRWRDIAVMARNWDSYDSLCSNVFEKYDIPFFTGGRSEILNKPPIALLDTALEIVSSDWEYKPIFRYLKTGLLGISTDKCALLENYVLKWKIRGALWLNEWTLPLAGYFDLPNRKSQPDPLLIELNELRQRIIKPLIELKDKIKGDSSIVAKLHVLYKFVEDIELPEILEQKANDFERRGEKRLADEYAQTWRVIKIAMEQMHMIYGFSEEKVSCKAGEFRKLFMLALSCYDVGAIPASLDRTTLGGMQMNRRRDLKCLIILGATDDELPMIANRGGVFSNSERSDLVNLGIDIPAGFEERLNREMNMIYSTLTLPTEKLVLSWPASAAQRPSMYVKRIKKMFKIEEVTLKKEEYMTAALTPCFELAAYSKSSDFGHIIEAAREYFAKYSEEGLEQSVDNETDVLSRGSLSSSYAGKLYGEVPVLTPSKVDKYFSCPYLYFLHDGLKLKPRTPAGFDAMAQGLFMHYILENVFREIEDTIGIKDADVSQCMKLVKQYVDKFASEELYSFKGKSSRFVYLFNRLEKDACRIVFDMIDELKNSEFKPLDFEFDISTLTAMDNSQQDMDGLMLRGIVDRIDGWTAEDGKLYLRVVDYKTGKKTILLRNLLYGLDMQMLIYLFAIEKIGAKRYGENIVPAGVMYIPARDAILDGARNSTVEDTKKLREKASRRSGLLIDDLKVVEAMEGGRAKRFLPVKHKKDGFELGDNFISHEQTKILSEHVRNMLSKAVNEISAGNIKCTPFFVNINDNACNYCEYKSVCSFDTELGDFPKIARSMKSEDVWRELRIERGERRWERGERREERGERREER